MSVCEHQWDDGGCGEWWAWICLICGDWGYNDAGAED